MDYIASGSIAPGVLYQVVTNSITYNSTTLNPSDEFIGVLGVTTFTGSGQVIDIIAFYDLTTEMVDNAPDIVFPEQLELYDLTTEMVQNMNGTIYPEQLELYSLSTELGDKKKTAGAMLVYSQN
jgi:hypothetical protein